MSEHLLTAEERRVLDLTADLANLLRVIVGHGPSREGDLDELCRHIHAIQHAVLAQAAARLWPDRYRPLGGEILSSTAEARE